MRPDEAKRRLTPEQREFWDKHDHLVLPSYFDRERTEKMIGWVEDIGKWPVVAGKYLNYYEMIGGKPQISRTENFLPYHPEFDRCLRASGIFEIIAELLGEPVVLFKEKINYKYPGTGEYPPHQDAHGHDTSPYAFQTYHRLAIIFLDEATVTNGCMELGWGYEKNRVLDRDANGVMLESECEKLSWKPLPCPAGSVLVFDTYWPHRSHVNNDSQPRRTIFMTFNGASKGDLREAHYRDKASGKPNAREIKSNLLVQTRVFGDKR